MKKSMSIFFLLCYLALFSKSEKVSYCIEPLIIKAGQPTIVIAAIFSEKDKNADDFYAKRELNELQINFPDYEIILVDTHNNVIFENDNKDILSLSDINKSYELVAFWDGKKASAIKVNKNKVKLTEYISGLTSADKKSSYIAENKKLILEYNKKIKTFNPDKNSKNLSQYFIVDRYFNKMIYGNVEFFKPQNYNTLQSVTVYSKLDDDPEELAFKMNFNAKKQVTDILYAKRASSDGSVFMVFSYDDNGLLKKMMSTENFSNEIKNSVVEYTFDKEKIIEYSDESMGEFSVISGILINSNYIEFKNLETNYRIDTSSEEIKDNCMNIYDNNQISTAYCPSNFNSSVPYTYENKIYQDGILVRKATSKIEKTGEGLFELYGYISAINEFKKIGEVVINKSGLTEKSTMLSRQQNYTLRFEYR